MTMRPNPLRVLLTGAAGRLGQTVLPALRTRHDVRAVDLLPGPGVDEHVDLTTPGTCLRLFDGVQAVVHLAANPDREADWDALLPANVLASHAVAQAAKDRGVPRLVLASSLQAVSGYPDERQVRVEDPPRPANLYGATKAWVEALGSWVAATSSTTVVLLRIGNFSPSVPDPVMATPRDVAAWLSPGDAERMALAAVDGQVASGQAAIINGVSANRWRKADLGEPERRLGYHPEDDAFAG